MSHAASVNLHESPHGAQFSSLGKLIGVTPRMQDLFQLIRQAGPSRACVLITGESGTGKELVARTIHNLSPRQGGPFVAINCAAMPETLIESELFGYEKGAFTGAHERRPGCFENAQGGTLLLDEIAEMPIPTQAKLLRVLDNSRLRRIGAEAEFEVDVRVLAATNKTAEKAVASGLLRQDLYYRLNVFHIHLPPLRERMEDLCPIITSLLSDLNRKHECQVGGVSAEVVECFRRYNWPGNVRELRNVLEHAVILAREGVIEMKHLPAAFRSPAPAVAPQDPNMIALPVGTTLDAAEKIVIQRTLAHTFNHKTRAAEILGISLKTLHNKLKRYESDG